MDHYCTLFDSFYLSRGLAMYRSLQKQSCDFHLYIFPFDEQAREMLDQLALNHVTLVPLSEFESEELREAKKTRTKGEYCWTCTPYIISYCISRFNLHACTYIDADLYFFSDPRPLILEMKQKSVLITEHRYTAEYDKRKRKGIYCVQFITFKNDPNGLEALNWWRDRCLEWCYDKVEDGKFGDQKYLDDWPERFSGVHVLEHLGGGVAPWNAQQYTFKKEGERVEVSDSKEARDVIFYHFHYLKFYANQMIDLGIYPISDSLLRNIYDPYLIGILEAEDILLSRFAFNRITQKYFYKNTMFTLIHRYVRKLLGVYNLYTLTDRKNGVLH